MPHLSDGDLHAWLDGAIAGTSSEGESLRLHLEACADCACRLEGARELKALSGSILASAVPRDAAPSFEEIQRKALAESNDLGRKSGFRPLRAPWLSVQRLGWAATVALALGAGWIGRAVLEERGWTDPFHEGPPAVASQALDTETDADDAAAAFAREQAAPEEKVGDVGGRTDGQGAGNENGGRWPGGSERRGGSLHRGRRSAKEGRKRREARGSAGRHSAARGSPGAGRGAACRGRRCRRGGLRSGRSRRGPGS